MKCNKETESLTFGGVQKSAKPTLAIKPKQHDNLQSAYSGSLPHSHVQGNARPCNVGSLVRFFRV